MDMRHSRGAGIRYLDIPNWFVRDRPSSDPARLLAKKGRTSPLVVSVFWALDRGEASQRTSTATVCAWHFPGCHVQSFNDHVRSGLLTVEARIGKYQKRSHEHVCVVAVFVTL
jgi:hypothetical protein